MRVTLTPGAFQDRLQLFTLLLKSLDLKAQQRFSQPAEIWFPGLPVQNPRFRKDQPHHEAFGNMRGRAIGVNLSRSMKRIQDDFYDSFNIFVELRIVETDNAKAAGFEKFRALSIARGFSRA